MPQSVPFSDSTHWWNNLPTQKRDVGQAEQYHQQQQDQDPKPDRVQQKEHDQQQLAKLAPAPMPLVMHMQMPLPGPPPVPPPVPYQPFSHHQQSRVYTHPSTAYSGYSGYPSYTNTSTLQSGNDGGNAGHYNPFAPITPVIGTGAGIDNTNGIITNQQSNPMVYNPFDVNNASRLAPFGHSVNISPRTSLAASSSDIPDFFSRKSVPTGLGTNFENNVPEKNVRSKSMISLTSTASSSSNASSSASKSGRTRHRRKFKEIERYYKCTYTGCTKEYGTLNHLNTHINIQLHGEKKRPEDYIELRRALRAKKRELMFRKRNNSIPGSGITFPFNAYLASTYSDNSSPSSISNSNSTSTSKSTSVSNGSLESMGSSPQSSISSSTTSHSNNYRLYPMNATPIREGLSNANECIFTPVPSYKLSPAMSVFSYNLTCVSASPRTPSKYSVQASQIRSESQLTKSASAPQIATTGTGTSTGTGDGATPMVPTAEHTPRHLTFFNSSNGG